jgi:AcrR family transcriptional regulator
VAGLSLRAIAQESRVSTSPMLHHFGSLERLLVVAANWTGRARLREMERRSPHVLLARVLGLRLGSPDVVPVTALIEGLRVGLSAPVRPLPPVRARELLAAYVASNPALDQQEVG